MYSPSLFFGGSSLIHLLASHPRAVAVFGLGALVSTLLQSPFGTPDVIGVAGYVKQLDQVARQQELVDPQVVFQARATAGVLAGLPKSRLNAIVEETLRECGVACISVQTSAVLNNQEMLADVLLLHTLTQANGQRAATRVKSGAAPPTGSRH
jgi:hypothetical protein